MERAENWQVEEISGQLRRLPKQNPLCVRMRHAIPRPARAGRYPGSQTGLAGNSGGRWSHDHGGMHRIDGRENWQVKEIGQPHRLPKRSCERATSGTWKACGLAWTSARSQAIMQQAATIARPQGVENLHGRRVIPPSIRHHADHRKEDRVSPIIRIDRRGADQDKIPAITSCMDRITWARRALAASAAGCQVWTARAAMVILQPSHHANHQGDRSNRQSFELMRRYISMKMSVDVFHDEITLADQDTNRIRRGGAGRKGIREGERSFRDSLCSWCRTLLKLKICPHPPAPSPKMREGGADTLS